MANNTSLYKANSYQLNELYVTNWEGKKLDISTRFMAFDINESVFNSCISGSLTLEDSDNFVQNFPFIGEETITMNFTIDEETDPYIATYSIYHIGDITDENQNLQTYTLHFCSEEMLKNKSVRKSKGYVNKSLCYIVEDLFSVIESKKELFFTECIGSYDYVSPNDYPFHIINSLMTKGVHKDHPNGSAFVFFENQEGFHFDSLERMTTDDATETFTFTINMSSSSPKAESLSINAYEISKKTNVLDNIQKGTYGNKVSSFDMVTKTYKEKRYEYTDDKIYSGTTHNIGSGSFRLQSDSFNYANADAYVKFVVSDSGRKGSSFFNKHTDTKSTDPKDSHYSKRITQLNQFTNMMNLIVEIPGNNTILCGTNVNLIYPSYTAIENDMDLKDVYLEGKYLVMSLRHVITRDKYLSIMELSRDQLSSNIKDQTSERNKHLRLF